MIKNTEMYIQEPPFYFKVRNHLREIYYKTFRSNSKYYRFDDIDCHKCWTPHTIFIKKSNWTGPGEYPLRCRKCKTNIEVSLDLW